MVSQGLEKVKQEAKECEDRLRSSDMESLLEHEDAKDKKKDPLPKLSSAISPVLTPSQIDTGALTEMFGQLTVPKSKQRDKTTQSTAAGYGKPSKALARDSQTRGTTAPTKSRTQLISKPSVLSEFWY